MNRFDPNGISLDTIFDAETQDLLAMSILKKEVTVSG